PPTNCLEVGGDRVQQVSPRHLAFIFADSIERIRPSGPIFPPDCSGTAAGLQRLCDPEVRSGLPSGAGRGRPVISRARSTRVVVFRGRAGGCASYVVAGPIAKAAPSEEEVFEISELGRCSPRERAGIRSWLPNCDRRGRPVGGGRHA